jgi:myo-inositol-1(or 4)-monophosphatase
LPATDPSSDLTALSAILVDAVREAGAAALASFRRPLKRWTKHGASPVCEADIAVDALLRERLHAAAPDYGWLSEEGVDDLARLTAKRIWVVDPIDGTRAYIDGIGDWAVAAALVENGRPIVGVIFAPVEGSLFAAVAGRGATRNGAPMRASAGTALDGARIAGPRRQLEKLAAAVPGFEAMPKIHSLALRLARVADGTLDAAFAARSSHDWDLAAADLLVHEAGGALTTIEGRVLTYNCADPVHAALIAAGQTRHRALIDLVNARKLEFA